MTNTTTKRLVAALALLLGAAACDSDLTVEPRSTVTAANIFSDRNSYRAFLAKLYGGLSVTGQSGPDGSGDIGGIDEGFSQYMRQYWQLQELPTEEAIIAWGDIGLPELNTQLWSSSNPFIAAMYARVFFQVSLANEFLRETTDEKLAGRNVDATLKAQIQTYRAEARFLRALSYWHGLDLYGNIPLVKETDAIGKTPPPQATRTQVFDYVVSELNAIRASLPAAKTGEYGRADQAAVDMLLAKLYLNSVVYTGTARWTEARQAAENVINSSKYSLDPNFLRMFGADNHTSPELIFTVPQDGLRTRTWGGMTFLVHANIGGPMDPAKYGVNGGWWGIRARPEAYNKYSAGDGRASFFVTQGFTPTISAINQYTQGIGAPKYRNITAAGAAGSHPEFPDTDFPMFRLADAYLIYAEAVVRGGGGSTAQALTYVNALRQRAFGNTSGNITAAQLTTDFILDERLRELFWEGHRRQDLIRYDRFTDNGVWTFKGNVPTGRTTDSFRDLYPIPASELIANPNLKQNTGY